MIKTVPEDLKKMKEHSRNREEHYKKHLEILEKQSKVDNSSNRELIDKY